jgi:protein NrfD
MIPAPSSTWFSAPPHWGWLIVLYFFVGGLAGGSYFLAALIDLVGRREDRPLAHLGYYIAFPCITFGALLLTLDLTRPLRFWHMMVASNTYRPMVKLWSPMSLGASALLAFGFFTFLSFLAALAEDGVIRWSIFRQLRPPAPAGNVVAAIGGIAGFYVASYTGVLLAVSNRPIWSDTPLLGLLFITSAASTSAALIMLLADRSGLVVPALADLHRMDDWLILMELVVLAALVISLGSVARAWMNGWGLGLAAVVVFGNVLPLILGWQARQRQELKAASAAVLILLGGLLLRVVIVFSAESV